jgi:diguanylate cyclase (GGDEF)-like protein
MEHWTSIVADRDGDSRNLLDQVLSELNCEVVAASTHEAIDAAMQEHKAALLWIGERCPGVDPLRLCAKAHTANGGAYYYVVFAVEKRASDSVKAAFEAGADEVLAKPLVATELRARLRHVRHLLSLEKLRKTVDSEGAWLAEIATTRTLYSQRYLQTQLDNEVARSRRFSHPLSLILAEVRDGDERVARRFGQVLSSQLRAHVDWVAQYGARRIAIVLPETDLGGAVSVAERLRGFFASPMVQAAGLPEDFSVSLGISALGALSHEADDSSHALLAAAETYLNDALRKGMNGITAGPVLWA